MKISTKVVLGLLLTIGSSLYVFRDRLRATGSEGGTSHATDPAAVSVLRKSLANSNASSRAAALEWMSRNTESQDESLIGPVFNALKDADASVRNEALANMGWIYDQHLNDDLGRRALTTILDALNEQAATDADRSSRLVAVDVLRSGPEINVYTVDTTQKNTNPLLANPQVQAAVAELLRNGQSGLRPQLLRLAADSAALRAVPAVIAGLGDCLADDDLSVRSDAVDLLIEINSTGGDAARQAAHPLLLTALREGDPNVQLRASKALGMPVPPKRAAAPLLSLTGQRVAVADVPFDFNYFTAFVQPLFVKKYGDEACVDCHTPQANASGAFKILPPGADGRYTIEQSKVNFASVLSVIDRQDPVRSKLLLKPLDPRTQEGKVHGMEHDGGVFWANQYDPDFELVRDWLQGAKLETPPDKQLDFAYFVQHVEPVFATPGPDGIACINCHSTHAILHLLSPETREGQFSVEQLVNNYQSAHRVIDEAAPTDSFIVRKPTSLREGEPGGLSHAGGIRWPDTTQSWQYKALVTWMGMRNLDDNGKLTAQGSGH